MSEVRIRSLTFNRCVHLPASGVTRLANNSVEAPEASGGPGPRRPAAAGDAHVSPDPRVVVV